MTTSYLPDPIIRYALDDAGPRCPCEWEGISLDARDGETVTVEHDGDGCRFVVEVADSLRAERLAEEMTTDGYVGVEFEEDSGDHYVYARVPRPAAWGAR